MNTASFKTAVSDLTGRIDAQLAALGAAGPDLYERVCSLQRQLDEYEFRQLRFIGVVARELAETPGYQFKGEPQRFVDTCEWAIERLGAQVRHREEQQRSARLLPVDGNTTAGATVLPTWARQKARLLLVAGAGLVCLVLLPFFCVQTVERSEWPSGRTYTEDVANWPIVIFCTLALMLVVFQTLKFVARRV